MTVSKWISYVGICQHQQTNGTVLLVGKPPLLAFSQALNTLCVLCFSKRSPRYGSFLFSSERHSKMKKGMNTITRSGAPAAVLEWVRVCVWTSMWEDWLNLFVNEAQYRVVSRPEQTWAPGSKKLERSWWWRIKREQKKYSTPIPGRHGEDIPNRNEQPIRLFAFFPPLFATSNLFERGGKLNVGCSFAASELRQDGLSDRLSAKQLPPGRVVKRWDKNPTAETPGRDCWWVNQMEIYFHG